MDVSIGIMDKDAGLRIPRRVDVEVVPAAGDASAHILAVVLEVHGEKRDGAVL